MSEVDGGGESKRKSRLGALGGDFDFVVGGAHKHAADLKFRHDERLDDFSEHDVRAEHEHGNGGVDVELPLGLGACALELVEKDVGTPQRGSREDAEKDGHHDEHSLRALRLRETALLSDHSLALKENGAEEAKEQPRKVPEVGPDKELGVVLLEEPASHLHGDGGESGVGADGTEVVESGVVAELAARLPEIEHAEQEAVDEEQHGEHDNEGDERGPHKV